MKTHHVTLNTVIYDDGKHWSVHGCSCTCGWWFKIDEPINLERPLFAIEEHLAEVLPG